MRRSANYIVPLLAAFTFVTVRLLSPNANSWTKDSSGKIFLGAIFVALVSYSVCAVIDWVAKNNRSRPKNSGE